MTTRSRSLLAGMTDYTGVPMDDILAHLRGWRDSTRDSINKLKRLVREVQKHRERLDGPRDIRDYLNHFIDLFARYLGDPKDLMAQVEELNRGFTREQRGRKTQPQTRRAQLVIHPHAQSYVLSKESPELPAKFNGTFLVFDLAIENTGDRTSNIKQYELRVRGVDSPYSCIPSEKPMLQGRTSNYAFSRERFLTKDGYIRIPPEEITPRGFLILFLPHFVPEKCPKESKFQPIDCKLKLVDTLGSEATQDFHLEEAS